MLSKKNDGDRAAFQGPAEIFLRIGRALTSSLEPKEVFRRVMEVISEYFNPQYWSLLLMDDEERLRFEITEGIDANSLEGFFLNRGEGIAGWVGLYGKPLVVEDVLMDPRFCPKVDEITDFKTRSVVCVPILDRNNRVMGVIELINKIAPQSKSSGSSHTKTADTTVDAFTPMDMMILSSIGAFTGIAVENAMLHQKVSELALIDSLTGINNRHYFNEMFRKEIERLKRLGGKLCILMMDIDGLKAINDTHGHLTGDKVLRIIAGILKSTARASDVLARFGGDEFILLMPQSDETVGIAVANRIQDLIDRWNDNPAISGVSLGISFGIHASGAENAEKMLKKADQKLYRFKRSPNKSKILRTKKLHKVKGES